MIRKILFVFCVSLLSLFLHCKKEKTNNPTDSNIKDTLDFSIKDTLLNSSEFLIIGPKNGHIQITDSLSASSQNLEILGVYKNKYITSKNLQYEDVMLFKKYTPTYTFEDFKTTVYSGTLASPDFETYPEAKLFKTRITNACKEGVNFGGSYTLVSIGCGTACQSNFIVDRKSGAISPLFVSSLGVDFREDSSLIIKNYGALDTHSNLIEICPYCEIDHYVWDTNSLKLLEE